MRAPIITTEETVEFLGFDKDPLFVYRLYHDPLMAAAVETVRRLLQERADNNTWANAPEG